MSQPIAPAHLTVVGVGPGDPGLVTVAGVQAIGSAEVIAYFSGCGRPSMAAGIAAGYLRPDQHTVDLRFPVTTGDTDHPGGYYGAMADFYGASADQLAQYLDAGRSVVLLAEGDAFFYGSFMYVHDRLAGRYPITVIPGVTSVQAASAAVPVPLARHEDVLTVLPGTLAVPELARRLADTDAAVIMKLGRTFPAVREALRQAGLLDRAVYVERASSSVQRVLPVAEVDAASVPYMSIIVVPGHGRMADAAGRAQHVVAAAAPSGAGQVYVVGLGPGHEGWLTPEASEVLSRVGHVVGYAPYVDRVGQREGLQRHASGNTVEVERARFALDLALAGQQVALVSGGDAGIFGMASAVYEALEHAVAEDDRYAKVPITVIPGLTAAQAVAARAGAPLGADWAMVSLSDRLKPWSVLEERLRHIAWADLVLAIYNPRSRSRPDLLSRAVAVLGAIKPASTVVVVGRHIGRADETLTVTTLGELDPQTVDMACLVIVGAAATQVGATGAVWTARFVRAD